MLGFNFRPRREKQSQNFRILLDKQTISLRLAEHQHVPFNWDSRIFCWRFEAPKVVSSTPRNDLETAFDIGGIIFTVAVAPTTNAAAEKLTEAVSYCKLER
jgi:hypothetical protein